MKARKTIDVETFKRGCNLALASEDDRSPEWRAGLASALEHALHMANQYHGFRYVGTEGAERTAEGGLVPGTYDESRRLYF